MADGDLIIYFLFFGPISALFTNTKNEPNAMPTRDLDPVTKGTKAHFSSWKLMGIFLSTQIYALS